MEPQIRYATTTDGINIAYWTMGAGIPLLDIHPFGFSNIQLDWQDPTDFHHRVAEKHRLIRFDHRGCGLSDRNVADLSPVRLLSDLEAVVEHVSLDRFAIFTESAGAHVAIDYAVAHPEKVSALLLHDGFARAEDFWRIPRVRSLFHLIDDWEMFSESLASAIFGWDASAPAREFAAYIRASTTPEAMTLFLEPGATTDVTDKLAEIRVPTLVIQEREVVFPSFEMARTLAARIPSARLSVIESGTLWSPEVQEALLATLEDFIREVCGRDEEIVSAVPAGGLRSILFTDIVGHTEMMQRLGDAKGRDVLREHERITRETLKIHGGTEVKTMGDGFMASFSSVTKAMDCAIALQRAFAAHTESMPEPLHVRVGLNAGEPIEEDGDLFGSAVILASRIAARAAGGEILTSVAIRELCAGKNFLFADRGETVLRGFEDPVRMYEVRWRV